jgi:purine-nucleoside phosphorylase
MNIKFIKGIMGWRTLFLLCLIALGLTCLDPAAPRPKAAQPPVKLLLAALPGELAGLEHNPPPGWVCALTGVGSIAAASATTRMILELRPAQVIQIGTCGTYDRARIPVGSFVGADAAVSTSPDELRGIIHRPKAAEQTRWNATVRTPFPPRTVVVTPGITMDPEAARLLATQGDVEHMELAGVFAACAACGVPCGGALVVTNQVGPGARAEYLANRDEASRRLVQALEQSGLFKP